MPSDAYLRQQNNHLWFRKWLVAWSAPSHYLNHCWIMVNWTLRNKFQGNRNQSVILSRPQCVDASNCQLTNISTICDIPVSRINSSPPVQNSRRFADEISECIFMNENVWIWIKISLKVVPMGLIDNKWALVRVMAWRWSGDKPFSETILTRFTDVYMRHYGEMIW